MVTYAVELYLSRSDAGRLDELVQLARRACRELRGGCERIRYLSALLLTDDETAFLLVEASTPDVVRRFLQRTGLTGERLHPAVVYAEES